MACSSTLQRTVVFVDSRNYSLVFLEEEQRPLSLQCVYRALVFSALMFGKNLHFSLAFLCVL